MSLQLQKLGQKYGKIHPTLPLCLTEVIISLVKYCGVKCGTTGGQLDIYFCMFMESSEHFS